MDTFPRKMHVICWAVRDLPRGLHLPNSEPLGWVLLVVPFLMREQFTVLPPEGLLPRGFQNQDGVGSYWPDIVCVFTSIFIPELGIYISFSCCDKGPQSLIALGAEILKSECQQSCIPLGGSGENLFSCLFQHLEASALFSQWHPPLSSKPAA